MMAPRNVESYRTNVLTQFSYIFWNIFSAEKTLSRKLFQPKIFWSGNICDKQTHFNQICFLAERSFGHTIFPPKMVSSKTNQEYKRFWRSKLGQTHFPAKMFLAENIFGWIFLERTFFAGFFWAQKHFGRKGFPLNVFLAKQVPRIIFFRPENRSTGHFFWLKHFPKKESREHLSGRHSSWPTKHWLEHKRAESLCGCKISRQFFSTKQNFHTFFSTYNFFGWFLLMQFFGGPKTFWVRVAANST